MPRIKYKPPPARREMSPLGAGATPRYRHPDFELPQIGPDDEFKVIVSKLSRFFAEAIDLPSTFEQLRTTSAGDPLRQLVDHLSKTCTNLAIVNALLALRWHYSAEYEHRDLSESRANACEIVAWRFLSRQSERDTVDYCLYEIPGKDALSANPVAVLATQGSGAAPFPGVWGDEADGEAADELSPLLLAGPLSASNGLRSNARLNDIQNIIPRLTLNATTAAEDPRSDVDADGLFPHRATAGALKSLNALEIAVIADAKRFLSQHIVQKIITGLWHGDIVFWDTVSVHSTKGPRYYDPDTADLYSRLRVPKYLKAWEVAFFICFLILYYCVVVERSLTTIPTVEIVFYVWLVAYLWDEIQEWWDAGIFYLSDFWNLFDIVVIGIGVVFAILRIVGISTDSPRANSAAFDVLSLEALVVIPRICSFLSLSPYWGTLIPCLKEMGKDFVKFMILVVIIYVGFLTTFSLVARDSFTVGSMVLDITKIFYGNTGIGFDIMNQIDPNFGPPLMVLFITLSSILLTGSLTGMLSNSFSRVMAQAREEYLYFYSVYVLEASTSSRLTHFYPPFNLISLVFFRPWFLVFSKDDRFRRGRIIALKVTHLPIVSLIYLYESLTRKVAKRQEKEALVTFSNVTRGRSSSDAPRMRPFYPARSRNGSDSALHQQHQQHQQQHYQSQRRRMSEQLSPDGRAAGARPSSAQSWSADDDDASGPSNAELLRRIDKLTDLVMALQERNGTKLKS